MRKPSRRRSLERDWGGSLEGWEGLCLGEASAPSLPPFGFSVVLPFFATWILRSVDDLLLSFFRLWVHLWLSDSVFF